MVHKSLVLLGMNASWAPLRLRNLVAHHAFSLVGIHLGLVSEITAVDTLVFVSRMEDMYCVEDK